LTRPTSSPTLGWVSRPRVRPRFTLDLAIPPEQVIARVRARLAEDPKITGGLYRRTITLTVRKEDAHFWSPHLDIQLADTEEGGTRLSAMFAPAPPIWTTFMGVQFLFGVLAVSSAIYVASMYMLHRDVLIPLGAFVAFMIGGGLSYGAAYIGQGFGAEQMYELRTFLDHALED